MLQYILVTITDAAEKVLFGTTLEEKLTLSPLGLSDLGRKTALKTPKSPGRPQELALSDSGVRASFPGINVLDKEQPRGELLHFLANHELLASELMALVLLKFPEAPAAYRKGVYEAMREEQMHTLMYMRRMSECDIHFGNLPVNSYFWRLISNVQSPLEFVTKLNLTFEQANLDFSYHYAKLFRQVGDGATAAVLEKIYEDEIKHVGHGLSWFREWKPQEQSDWVSYSQSLKLPFSASKAKGIAPFNPEGRERAGFDQDFISNLSVYSQSRGRTPFLYWFNPNAERYAFSSDAQLTTVERQVEEDLELLMIAFTKQDDVLVLRSLPSISHLALLKEQGIVIPELLATDRESFNDRTFAGVIPWAWSSDASSFFAPYKAQLLSSSKYPWRIPIESHYLSKGYTVDLRSEAQAEVGDSKVYRTVKEVLERVKEAKGNLRVKPLYACSGRGQYQYKVGSDLGPFSKYLQRVMRSGQAVVIEPELESVCEFSVHYDADHTSKKVKLQGFILSEYTSKGQFVAAHASQKWAGLLDKEIATFLYSTPEFTQFYSTILPQALRQTIGEYSGPIGVDAMVYRSSKGLTLQPIVEVNVRHTMGRVALALRKQINAKKLSLYIYPKGQQRPPAAIPLNDPLNSQVLQAWLVKE